MDTPYLDTDFVYVDPHTKTVVGKVEFNANGEPIVKWQPPREPKPGKEKEKDGFERKPKKRAYPWGSYKTMRKLYKLEGKEKEAERTITLNDVIEKAVKEPYWNN